MGKKFNILFIVLAFIAGSAAVYIFFSDVPEKTLTIEPFDQYIRVKQVAQDLKKSIVHLYFTDNNNFFLISEKRSLLHPDNSAEFGKIILDALIKGPQKGLVRTIPAGTAVRALYVTKDGTAFADFTEAVKERHPGGIESERITIYSIVNSLVLNIPDIDSVKILIEGCETTTLAGHIDLRSPFKANMLLVR